MALRDEPDEIPTGRSWLELDWAERPYGETQPDENDEAPDERSLLPIRSLRSRSD